MVRLRFKEGGLDGKGLLIARDRLFVTLQIR